jgi:hypothetical protein
MYDKPLGAKSAFGMTPRKNNDTISRNSYERQFWFLRFPEMSQIQAIQLTSAVEMPSSGSARVKDENIAMIEMAVANKNGIKFFISAV